MFSDPKSINKVLIITSTLPCTKRNLLYLESVIGCNTVNVAKIVCLTFPDFDC